VRRRALVIGINDYRDQPLAGCSNDARAVAELLSYNADGGPNFETRLLVSPETDVTRVVLMDAVEALFTSDAETVVFYFAGHGILNPETNSGFLVTTDGNRGAWGLNLADLVNLANKAYPRIQSTVIILDSCHSGHIGELADLGAQNPTVISNGVTILTASERDGATKEAMGHGLFTTIFLDGLRGGSADIRGNITPASIYSHVDQTLGAWKNRPVYKANVQTFITLRKVKPKVPLEVLRRLPTYFAQPDDVFPLDPSYERDRFSIPEHLRHLPRNAAHEEVFAELQMCNRQGLVEPVDEIHMFYAAINSTGCRLTAIGKHYRELALKNRITD